MKAFNIIFFVFLLMSCHQKDLNLTEQSNYENDEQILRSMKEVLWPKAYREQDTILLNKILDESFELVDGNGIITTKKDEINWLKANSIKHDSFFYEIDRLNIYKNGTAIIAGKGHIYNDSIYSTYKSSNVLIKKDTTWKAILSHVSGFKIIN